MYRGWSVAVVMPAYNAARYVSAAVGSVPAFVDRVLVIDDGSADHTAEQVLRLTRPGLELIRHPENLGVGAAIDTGYTQALARGVDLVAVMAGDAQMDPADLPGLLDPLVERRADYAKGNRFLHPDVWRRMPPSRIVGNIVLSLLTKITSGYLRLFDSQCGYTAISRAALLAIDRPLFPRYGYPNDLLARLRTAGARVAQVCVRPVYEGQPSGIRLRTVLHPITAVLLRSLLGRIWRQHFRRLLLRRQPQLIAAPDADRPADHLLPAPPR